MSYVIYVCDTETTGIDPQKNEIIEICFWRLGDEDSKTWTIKPNKIENIENEALRVNKHKREDITHVTDYGRETYRPLEEVLPEIEMYFMEDEAAAEDRVLVGQNIKFDYEFILQTWKNAGEIDNFPFGDWRTNKDGSKTNNARLHDTLEFVKLLDTLLGKKRKFYNLGSLVKAFSITKAQAHRADGDVKMTKDLWLKLMEPMKALADENFSDCY